MVAFIGSISKQYECVVLRVLCFVLPMVCVLLFCGRVDARVLVCLYVFVCVCVGFFDYIEL